MNKNFFKKTKKEQIFLPMKIRKKVTIVNKVIQSYVVPINQKYYSDYPILFQKFDIMQFRSMYVCHIKAKS